MSSNRRISKEACSFQGAREKHACGQHETEVQTRRECEVWAGLPSRRMASPHRRFRPRWGLVAIIALYIGHHVSSCYHEKKKSLNSTRARMCALQATGQRCSL